MTKSQQTSLVFEALFLLWNYLAFQFIIASKVNTKYFFKQRIYLKFLEYLNKLDKTTLKCSSGILDSAKLAHFISSSSFQESCIKLYLFCDKSCWVEGERNTALGAQELEETRGIWKWTSARNRLIRECNWQKKHSIFGTIQQADFVLKLYFCVIRCYLQRFLIFDLKLIENYYG